MAEVTCSGPFSSFNNVARTIVQLEGDPITLFHEQSPTPTELQINIPYDFDGEDTTRAEVSSSGKDFNVMVDRDSAACSVENKSLSKQKTLLLKKDCDELFIFCLQGQLSTNNIILRQYDSLWVKGESTPLELQAIQDTGLLVVKISYKKSFN